MRPPRGNRTGSKTRSRHQTSDATSHTPSCQRSAFSAFGATPPYRFGTAGIPAWITSQVLVGLAVASMAFENHMGVARPCQPGTARFSVSQALELPRPVTALEESAIRSLGFMLFAVCGPARCGEEGTRTPDLLLAKQALYQLSYFPNPAGRPQPQCAYLDSNQGPQLYQSCALAN
jgi:hypothetical protein